MSREPTENAARKSHLQPIRMGIQGTRDKTAQVVTGSTRSGVHWNRAFAQVMQTLDAQPLQRVLHSDPQPEQARRRARPADLSLADQESVADGLHHARPRCMIVRGTCTPPTSFPFVPIASPAV